MKKVLDKKWYDLLKNMDYSLMDVDVTFDDENCTFETNDPDFDIIFDMNIVAYGMDKKQDQCTEYGRRLYMLYDLIFFSDAFDIKE